jgi:hypothetical protein
VREGFHDTERLQPLGVLSKEGKAKFRRVDGSRRDVRGRISRAVVLGRGIFAGQIRRHHGVRSATTEDRPPIRGIRKMDVEERNRGNPGDQPSQDQEMPIPLSPGSLVAQKLLQRGFTLANANGTHSITRFRSRHAGVTPQIYPSLP